MNRTIGTAVQVSLDEVEKIGVMDPVWCSETLEKIRKLNENCKIEPFSIPSESLATLAKEEAHFLESQEEEDVVDDITERISITTIGTSHSYASKNFEYFNSTKQASVKILKALEDEGSYIIGLHGKKGSGKTALVNAEIAKYEQIFNTVVTVTVSENVDIVKIQNQITPQLNMNSQAFRSQSKRASAIESTLLKNKGKVLVIFDHVWTNFLPQYVEEIGIPNPSNWCKILLITHDKKYCNMMGCHPWIPLRPLSKEDAWKLLQQYSGIDDEDDYSNEELLKVAHEVALQCKGLPGLIEDVVSSLNNKNTDDDSKLMEYWTESLDCLKHVGSRYQIFISFRGTDTRDDFTESLYDALDGAGFNVFIDRKIPSGDQVSETLIKVIEQSRASIVVLSENYAQSSWCLDELLKIMECREKINQLVYPIFYKVIPSDVRYVKGTYNEAMAKKEERFGKDKVQEWTSALFRVASLSGKHHPSGSHKLFIQEVVEYVKSNKHRLHIL